MLNNIPQNRLLTYIVVLGLLPLVFVCFNFYTKKSSLNTLENGIEELKTRAFITKKKQSVNVAVIDHYENMDRFYVDKNLETLVFLKPEIEGLKKITSNKNYAGDEAISKRLSFLTGKENRFLFSEGVVETYPLFQETILTLTRPVQINVDDLMNILARVEDKDLGGHSPQLNPPQLLITDFSLERKTITPKNEVFLLNLKILKREFL